MATAVPISVGAHQEFDSIDNWCDKHVGGEWTSVRARFDSFRSRIYYFAREQDAVFFVLRWK